MCQHPAERVGDPADLLLHQHLLQRRAAAAADVGRHVRRVQPELDRPRLVLPGQPVRQLRRRPARPRPRAGSARRRTRGRGACSVEVLARSGRTCACSSSARTSLTDCSVYASVGARDQRIGRRDRRRRRRRAAARSARGAPGSCAGRARPRRPASRRGTLGAGRQLARGRHGAGPGRHRDRRPARDVQPRLLRRPARRGSASTPASWRRATACRASPRRGRRRRTTGSRCSARSGSTCAGSTPTSSTRCNPAVAPRHDAGRVLRRRATATSTRRATCSPTRPRSSPPGVDVRERTAFTGLLVATVPRSPVSRRTGGRHRHRRVVLTGGPQLGRGRPRGRRTHPGGRRPASGRGHRAAPRPRGRPAADGLRRARPASTGGPRRAASCGG